MSISEIRHAWWSPNFYVSTGKCHIYEHEDGSHVAATLVSIKPFNSYGPAYQDAIYLGKVTKWLGNPVTASIPAPHLGRAPVWPKGSIPDLLTPVISTNPSRKQVPCDCALSVVLRSGCKDPNHY